MINTNELKRGNWFYDTIGGKYGKPGYQKVLSISEESVNHWQDKGVFGSSKAEDINPIPLTPEILDKAGLKRGNWIFKEGEYMLTEDIYINYTCNIYYKYWEGDGDQGGIETKTFCEIKYLHQLQNLYFALTGTELEINLNP